MSKAALVELRRLMVGRIAEILENAYLHDYGQRLPEIFLARAHPRDRGARAARPREPSRPRRRSWQPRAVDEIRYTIGAAAGATWPTAPARRRSTGCAGRRRWSRLRPRGRSPTSLRDDLLPFAELHLGPELPRGHSYLQGHLHIDAGRFRTIFRTTTDQIQALRTNDPNFDRVLAAIDPEAAALPARAPAFQRGRARPPRDLAAPRRRRGCRPTCRRLLADVARRFKRFEVISGLRDRVFRIAERGPHR